MKRPVMIRAKKRGRGCMKQMVMQRQEENVLGGEGDDPKWLTHYCSDHQILLVGEGDFSFSLSLAKGFGSASNIVASSLDTYGEVIKKYKHAKSNLDELQKMGACLLHGVDATKMKLYPDLKMRRFDRVIFNFPHAGFHGKEDNLVLIKMHRDLVFGFFNNASHMLRANGEIHVNHKTTPPFDYWNIEKLAMQSFLILIECADFKQEDYPGYNNKRGDGNRCDEPFPLGECSTFKFIYNPRVQKNHLRRNHLEVYGQHTNLLFREIQNLEQLPAPVDLNYYPQTNLFPKMNEPVRPVFDMRNGCTPISRDHNNVAEIHERVAFSADLRNEFLPISRNFFNNVTETHGRVAYSADLRNGYTPNSRDYYNNVTEMRGRVASSADYYYSARDMTLDSRRLLKPMDSLQSLQPWPASTNCRYSLTDDPLRRTMDITPSISLGARNEDHQHHQVFGGGSRYSQEELCRTAQRPTNCRYSLTDDPLRRTMDITPSIPLGARNEGHQHHQVFGGGSIYSQEELCRTAQRPTNCRYSLTDDPLKRTMDIIPSISLGAKNEGHQRHQVFGGSSRYSQEELCRTAQRPTNCRYSLTDDPLRRTMDITPSISLGARNEGYQHHQVFGGGSRYSQEELCRTAQRPSYCFEFDRARPDYFEKYNADVPRRTWNSEIYVAQ